jgi:hypothetical protein
VSVRCLASCRSPLAEEVRAVWSISLPNVALATVLSAPVNYIYAIGEWGSVTALGTLGPVMLWDDLMITHGILPPALACMAPVAAPSHVLAHHPHAPTPLSANQGPWATMATSQS